MPAQIERWDNNRERLLRWAGPFAKLCKRVGFEVTAAHVERSAGYLKQERARLVKGGAIGRAPRVSEKGGGG